MTATMHERVGGLDVSRETAAALRDFEAEVRRWNPTVNLVSRNSLPKIWGRHIEDSAFLFTACPPNARRWLDIGSGGGFPGLVIAVLANEFRPDLRVTLVESDQRKAAFLRQTARKLGLGAEVLAQRIESLPPQAADVISARALAPLVDLLALAAPHLHPDGIALFPKGERHGEEIDEARRSWAMDVETRPGGAHPGSALLILRRIHRA